MPQKRKYLMGSHYLGTSQKRYCPAKTKETHEQSTLSCPAASFCASFCSRQDLTGAVNQEIWAATLSIFARVLHSLAQRQEHHDLCNKQNCLSNGKKNQKTGLKFVHWQNLKKKKILEKYCISAIFVLNLAAWLYIVYLFWESLRCWSLYIQEVARCFLE